MPWNKPGGNQSNNPWGDKNRPRGSSDNGAQGSNPLEDLLRKFTGGNGGGSNGTASKFPWFIGAIGLLALLGFKGFYQLDEAEEAVVLTFGKYHETIGKGPHWYFPFIHDVEIVNANVVRDFTLSPSMITKDENIVDIDLKVQYRVSDTKAVVLNVEKPTSILRDATESALRHVVGSLLLNDVVSVKREEIATDMTPRLQEYLDNYESGLAISKVTVNEVQPPKEVEDAFLDVNRAIKNRDAEIDKARQYYNKVVTEAEGLKQQQIELATGYKIKRIEEAKGDASRFDSLYQEYRKAPKVTRDRLYLESMEKVYGSTTKILVDGENNSNLMYLPFDQLIQKSQANSSTQSSVSVQEQKNQEKRQSTASYADKLRNRVQ